MRAFLTAALAAAFACGIAQANDQTQPPANGDAAVGVICNTLQQAQQFVKLRSSGAKPEQAIRTGQSGSDRAHQRCR